MDLSPSMTGDSEPFLVTPPNKKSCFSQSLQHSPDLAVYQNHQLKMHFAGIGISQDRGWDYIKQVTR